MADQSEGTSPRALAHEAREQALQMSSGAADAHCKAAALFLQVGDLEEAAEDYYNAGLWLETTDVKRALRCLDLAAKYLGQAGNCERAGEVAERSGDVIVRSHQNPMLVAHQYMLAKNHYGNAGLYADSGRMYIAEMDARLKIERMSIFSAGLPLRERLTHVASWIGLIMWRFTCLYGEGLGRFLAVNVLVIVGFAVIYWIFGVLGPNRTTFIDSLVFSSATFPTFGVRDFNLVAGNPWPLIAVAEAFIGTASFGLFTSILVRKLSRR